jgi:hypothetical protein
LIPRSSRQTAVWLLVTIAYTLLAMGFDAASAQQRRKLEEPPSETLPAISEETARCSFAYHAALSSIHDRDLKPLVAFDQMARVTDPSVPGRWTYWVKTGKGVKAPPPERVCAETATRAGRERCVRWETKPADPTLAQFNAISPTADELTVLRALDAFVVDKGAALEFGPNGRQYATLQRVAAEIGSYGAQARHPALCNGVTEMMEFKFTKLVGLRKRFDDVAAVAAKALAMANKRVTAAREQRDVDARATAAVASSKPSDGDATATAAESPPSQPAKTPLLPMPPQADPMALIIALVDGILSPEQVAELKKQPSMPLMLTQTRELLTREPRPELTTAGRGAIGAALRMIEAAGYGRLQVARMQTFDRLFFGSINRILEAEKANCTCGG